MDDFHPVGEIMCHLNLKCKAVIIDRILETHWDYFTSLGTGGGVFKSSAAFHFSPRGKLSL